MNNFNPKQGEMILAREDCVHFAGKQAKFRFLCMEGDANWGIESGCTSAVKIVFCRPLPTKREPIAFTHETWPKQVVWLRAQKRSMGECFMVVRRYDLGVIHKGSYYSFQQLVEQGWEISLDHGATWQPCHYVPESEE